MCLQRCFDVLVAALFFREKISETKTFSKIVGCPDEIYRI